MLFSSTNLPYWILLGIGVLLFLIVILAGLGDEDLDLDNDTLLDADREITDENLEFLSWLGLGQAPLILLLAIDFSLWGLLGWMFNVWLGALLGGTPGNFGSFGVLLGSLVVAVILGRWIAYPVGKALAAFGEDPSSDRLIGRAGRVTSSTIPRKSQGKIGQVDVLDAAHNLVTISAVLPEWAAVPPQRGDKVLIIDRTPQVYFVIREDSPDQQLWLARSLDLPPKPDSK